MQLFEKLISVQGIGGSTALTVMSGMSSNELKEVVDQHDVDTLKSIKGVGIKTAQKLILELKGKLVSVDENRNKSKVREEAITALMSLGNTKAQASSKIDVALKSGAVEIEEIIRAALKS